MKLPSQSYDRFLLILATASAPRLAKELYQAFAKKTTESAKKQRVSKMFLPKPTVHVQNAARSLLMPSKDWQFGRPAEVLRGANFTWFAWLPVMIRQPSKIKDALSGLIDRAGGVKWPRISLSVRGPVLMPLPCTPFDAKRFKKPGNRLLLATIPVV